MRILSLFSLVALPLLLTAPTARGETTAVGDAGPVIVYAARRVITMEPGLPEATAVAVADGRIVGVGSVESLQRWIDARGGRIDRRLADKVLMPGFIDPHVHPSLPAVLTQFPFLAPDDWSLPTGEFPGARSPEDYRQALAGQVAHHYADPERDPEVPFISWGYHPLWHGRIRRAELNEWFGERPVMLWHRSFHEIVGNDAAFDLLGVTAADVSGQHEINWEDGHFWENGMIALVPNMPFLQAPERYAVGMANFIAMMHAGGVTSAMDMGVGIFGDPVGETRLIRSVMEGSKAPTRIVLTPIITDFLARGLSPEQALAEVQAWEDQDSERVLYDRHFKLMMDGAIFSGLAQYAYPGYMDGHRGQWMAPLDVTYRYAEVFWNAGYQLHAHTNGDASAAALLDLVQRLQAQRPRLDHRFTLEHFAYATEDQVRQMQALGMLVSANPYYQFILADIYADLWLGEDRARNMVPLGAARRQGMRVGLHSDCPMAPLSPLTLAWAAVNRVSINGGENAQAQALSVDEALRAITIDAAWLMRMEDEIGSIRAGKRADFAILEQDPYRVDPAKLRDLRIWGTVFGGVVHPVDR